MRGANPSRSPFLSALRDHGGHTPCGEAAINPGTPALRKFARVNESGFAAGRQAECKRSDAKR